MNLNDLENIIKSKYDAEQSDLNLDALWANVAPEIPREESNRKFIFWFMGFALIFLSLGFTGLYLFDSNSMTIEESFHPTDDESQILSEMMESKDGQTDQKVSQESIDQRIGEDHEEDKQTDEGSNTVEFKKEVMRLEETIVSMKEIVKSQNETLLQVASTLNIVSKKMEAQVNDPLKVATDKDDLTFTEVKEEITGLRKSMIKLDLLTQKMSPLEFDESRKSLQVQLTDIRESKKKIKNFYQSFEVLIGFGIAQKSLRSKENADENILKIRNENESTLEVLSFDLNYNRQLSEHLIFGTGLNYDLQTERTTHRFVNNEMVLIDDALLTTITDEGGNLQELIGSGLTNARMTTTKTRYNYYQKISLPFRLSYFRDLGKWKYDIGIGTRVNLYSQQSGFIQEEINGEYDIRTDELDYFNAQWSTELLGVIGFNYKVTESISWRSTFNYHFGVNGWETKNNPINQRYHLLNFKSGIQYRF